MARFCQGWGTCEGATSFHFLYIYIFKSPFGKERAEQARNFSLWACEVRTMPATGEQISLRAEGGTALRRRSRGRSRPPGGSAYAGPGGSRLPAAAAAARSRQVSGGGRAACSALLLPRRGAVALARPSPTRLVRFRKRGQERAGPWSLPPRFIPDLGGIGAGRGQAAGDAPGLGTWD